MTTPRGHFRVWCKGGERAFQFVIEDYEPFLAEWMAGASFITAQDEYGDPVTLKGGEIAAIMLSTPAALAQYEADKAAGRFAAGGDT
jgi:hypothetical protein